VSVERKWKNGSGVSAELAGRIRERFRSELVATLPLFEVQALVDTLHFYLSHAPDLIEFVPRIRVAASPVFLLGGPVRGSQARRCGAALADDVSHGQQWTYDRPRSTGTQSDPKHSLASLTTCGPVGGTVPTIVPAAPDKQPSSANASQPDKEKTPWQVCNLPRG